MRQALAVFLRDLKRILRNPVALVITLGVCVIPSVYAWLNILANWDPYKNTAGVPIAVVIEDSGAEVGDMGNINAGEQIHERLLENDQLRWIFVDSEDEAVRGVRAGDYYAAFVIPEDFTESLASVLEGNTDPAHITYYVNEKANAIAPKVTDTGATSLETQIQDEFIKVAGTTVTERLQEAAAGAADAVDDARGGVAADLRRAAELTSELQGSLDDARQTISQARASVADGRRGVSDLVSSAESLSGSLDDALATLSGTRLKAQALSSSLAGALGEGVATISGISSTASYDIGQISGDVGWAQGRADAGIAELRGALDDAESVRDRLASLRDRLAQVDLPGEAARTLRDQMVEKIDSSIASLDAVMSTQRTQLDRLQGISDDVRATNQVVRDLSIGVNDSIQASTGALIALQQSISTTTMPQVSGALDSFASAGGRMSGIAQTLPQTLRQADASLAELDQVLAQADQTLVATAQSLGDAARDVAGLADEVAALQSAHSFSVIQDVMALDAESVGAFLGSPAQMVSSPVFPVANYGSGVTPFYTNLALWVGGFVLVAVYKIEVDGDEVGELTHRQAFFGRWLLLNLLGQLQAVVCCVGDVLLGIQCVSPAAFVFAGMVESFVYVFFIYALAAAFKHIGKALGVLLVVLQIPGAAGTYPIEMMPDFFRAIHPWLPFTYGINAMREAVAGFYGTDYVHNLLFLLAFLIPALLVGVALRRHLVNINALFDRRLGETDLMISERVFPEGPGIGVAVTDEAGSKFERAYPTLVRRGFAAFVWVPLVLLGLLFVLPAKYLLLVCWIVSLVAAATFLIVVEFVHSRLSAKEPSDQKGGEAR